MQTQLPTDGKAAIWYEMATGQIKGMGSSTFEIDDSVDAVVEVDLSLTEGLDFNRFTYQYSGSDIVVLEDKSLKEARISARMASLEAKIRAKKALTIKELNELKQLERGIE